MAAEAGEYWFVIYKAIADFGDVISEAAKAKAALKDLNETVLSEGATEKDAANKAALAHKADTTSILEQKNAFVMLGDAAQRANVQTLYGGRSNMESHLGDMSRELQYKTLLNRQLWLGFTTPQQAYAWRQNEYNQRLLMNRAEWAGYQTADQYLQYLQRQTTGFAGLNSMLQQRALLYRSNADAALGYANALAGTHASIGQLSQGQQAFTAARAAGGVLLSDLRGPPDSAAASWNDLSDAESSALVTAKLAANAQAALGAKAAEAAAGVTALGDSAFYSTAKVRLLTNAEVEAANAGISTMDMLQGDAEWADKTTKKVSSLTAAWNALTDAEKAAVAAGGFAEDAHALPAAGGGGGGGGPPVKPAVGAGGGPDPGSKAAWAALAMAMQEQAAAASQSVGPNEAAAKAAIASGGGARFAGGWWGLWNKQISLFGGAFGTRAVIGGIGLISLAIHTLIDALIVVIPALIAAATAIGVFALAVEPSVLDMIAHFTGLHTALDAFGSGADVLGTTHVGPLTTKMNSLNATMKPMPITIRSIQDAMMPTAVTLYGAAFSGLGTHMATVQQIAQKTGTFLLDTLVKFQNALNSPSGQKSLATFIAVATHDMQILMGIGASLLKIFDEFVAAGEKTHVAELLFSGLAYVLSVVAKALHAIGPDALALGIAFFSIVHYGGALTTLLQNISIWLVKLLSGIPLVGAQLAKLVPLLASPWFAVGVAVGAAVLLIIHNLQQADAATKAFIKNLQDGLASASASQAFSLILKNTAAISTRLGEVAAGSRNFVGVMAQGWHDLAKDSNTWFGGLAVYGRLWKDFTEILGHSSAQADTTALLKEQRSELHAWSDEVQAAGAASKRYGVTVVQAFSLMDLAGVKTSDTFSVMVTKVNDLVSGWINMGVAGLNTVDGMNQLGNATNAVTLAAEVQNSAITTLTGDYSSFLSLVQGGQTSFDKFGLGILTIAGDAKTAGASFTGLNKASLTLRKDWEDNLTAGQGLYNNLVLQNAAAGNTAKTNASLAASGRDMVSVLLAQGGATTESVQGAYALAQTMGYAGKNTYDALLKWSGGNRDVTKTTRDLSNQVGTLETGSSNLNTDVLNLAAAINTNLTQAIAQGLVNMPKITKIVSDAATAVANAKKNVNAGIETPAVLSSAKALYGALIAIYGTTPAGLAQAKAQFQTVFADLGVKKGQVDTLWKDVANPPKPKPINLDMFLPPPATVSKYFDIYKPPANLNSWKGFWGSIGGFFNNDVWMPVNRFFTSYIPSWAKTANNVMAQFWTLIGHGFVSSVVDSVLHFFTALIPGWVSNALKLFDGFWSNVAHYFGHYLVSDVKTFITSSIPNWLDGLGRQWNSFWSGSWSQFVTRIIDPMKNFFTTTMPNVITQGIKGGMNGAITGIRSVENFINNDVLGHLPGGLKIPLVPFLAAGGSVPGTGDEDGTTVVAMGGEYMLRKPARMALQQRFGHGFLDHLNQADQWLGAGSRGNAASQRGMASGGLVNPIGRGLVGERVDMGVDYGGSGPLYAIGSGTITNLWNSGWPGGGFIGERLNPPYGSGYWYLAENVVPLINQGVHVGASVRAGQHIADAAGGGPGIEVGWAAPPGTGQTAAAAAGQASGSGDPGANPTAWGVAASKLIASLGGPAGIISGKITGGTGGLGFITQAWQSVEGLLNAVGDALSGNIKPLAGYVKGGATELLKLAKLGSKAVFDGVWGATIGPMVGAIDGNVLPGALIRGAAQSIKGGIDAFMGGQDTSAKANAAAMPSGGNLGAGGPGPASAQKWMHAHLKDYTWGEDQWNSLLALWNGESGWRWNAQNPTSPAYGIPQADPGSKMSTVGADWRTNPVTQMRWGAEYIRGTPGYGTPSAAYSKWLGRSPHWYAGGGPVLDAPNVHLHSDMPGGADLGDLWMSGGGLKQMTPRGWRPYSIGGAAAGGLLDGSDPTDSVGLSDGMAAGGPFKTVAEFRARLANRQAGERAKFFGVEHSYAIGPASARTKLTMQELATLARHQANEVAAYSQLGGAGLTASHLSHFHSMVSQVDAPARDATLGRSAAKGGHPAFVHDLRGFLHDLSVLSGEKIPPGSLTASPGIKGVADWTSAAGSLNTAVVSDESPAFWGLMGQNLSAIKGITPTQAGKWHAWRTALEKQQYKTIGLGHNPPGAYAAIEKNLATPGKITAGDWSRFASDLNYLTREEAGTGIPGGFNPPGTPANSGEVPWHYFKNQWTALRKALLKVEQREPLAQKVWANVYGPNSLPAFPGPIGGTGGGPIGGTGGGTGGGVGTINLAPLIPMGPALPVQLEGPSLSATGSGFAAGGELGQVGAMFAVGGPMDFSSGGNARLPQGLVASLENVAQGTPRTVTTGAAGAAGDRIGVQVGNLTIMNPVPEKPSDSITRSSNRLAFLAGRGSN